MDKIGQIIIKCGVYRTDREYEFCSSICASPNRPCKIEFSGTDNDPLWLNVSHEQCCNYIARRLPIQQTYLQRSRFMSMKIEGKYNCVVCWTQFYGSPYSMLSGICVDCLEFDRCETCQLITSRICLARVLLPELAMIIVGIMINFLPIEGVTIN